jgi:hypothetical protein
VVAFLFFVFPEKKLILFFSPFRKIGKMKIIIGEMHMLSGEELRHYKDTGSSKLKGDEDFSLFLDKEQMEDPLLFKALVELYGEPDEYGIFGDSGFCYYEIPDGMSYSVVDGEYGTYLEINWREMFSRLLNNELPSRLRKAVKKIIARNAHERPGLMSIWISPKKYPFLILEK